VKGSSAGYFEKYGEQLREVPQDFVVSYGQHTVLYSQNSILIQILTEIIYRSLLDRPPATTEADAPHTLVLVAGMVSFLAVSRCQAIRGLRRSHQGASHALAFLRQRHKPLEGFVEFGLICNI
jgi:hypothetical protein